MRRATLVAPALALLPLAIAATPTGAATVPDFARAALIVTGVDNAPDPRVVAGAGDVNGDGIGDLVVRNPGLRGGAFVVFGVRGGGRVRLGSPGSGFTIVGPPSRREVGLAAGSSVAGAGDVDGDGLDDVIVGLPFGGRTTTAPGTAFVVFGKRDGTTVDLARIAGRGYRIDGARAEDEVGSAVTGAGDVDGDGRPDQLVGGERSAYLVYGAGRRGAIDLAHPGDAATPLRAAVVPGSDSDLFGVAGAGDVNGDGRSDVVVEVPQATGSVSASRGASYVLFGSPDRRAVRVDRLGARGIEVREPGGPIHENGVAAAGDTNGDGLADLLFDSGGDERAAASVVFGRRDAGRVDLARLGAGGVELIADDGSAQIEAAGALAGVGDVNGDGLADVALGRAWRFATCAEDAGGVAVVYGRTGPGKLRLPTATGPDGYLIHGEGGRGSFGSSVAAPGDVTGDGVPDIVVTDQPSSKSADMFAFSGDFRPPAVPRIDPRCVVLRLRPASRAATVRARAVLVDVRNVDAYAIDVDFDVLLARWGQISTTEAKARIGAGATRLVRIALTSDGVDALRRASSARITVEALAGNADRTATVILR